MNAFVREPTCADDDDSDWDQIRSDHFSTMESAMNIQLDWCLRSSCCLIRIRFGSVRWNDARVSACLIDISFVSLSEEKPRTVNASAVSAGKCQQVQLSVWGRRGSELKLTAQTSERTMRRLLQHERERERERERAQCGCPSVWICGAANCVHSLHERISPNLSRTCADHIH